MAGVSQKEMNRRKKWQNVQGRGNHVDWRDNRAVNKYVADTSNGAVAQKRNVQMVDLTEDDNTLTTVSPPQLKYLKAESSSSNHNLSTANKNRTVTPPRKKFDGAATGSVQINTHTDESRFQAKVVKQNQKPEFLEAMNRRILEHHEASKQSDRTYKQKLDLVDMLFQILVELYPTCGLYLVGSSVNGFGNESSDIDLCLMLQHGEVSRGDAMNVLSRVKQRLQGHYPKPLNSMCTKFARCRNFMLIVTSVHLTARLRKMNIIKATVPILDFFDTECDVDCDMNINNSTGIKNSHLLHCYSTFDDRVAPLVMFVKKWAKYQNINSAQDRTLSSYSLTLMVLHYLQYGVRGKPVLPCLQRMYPELFPGDITKLKMDITFKPLLDKNEMSLGELLVGFFEYYTNTYRFKAQVASVRCGGVLPLHQVRHREYSTGFTSPGNTGRQGRSTYDRACMFVEEPFNLTNAARCVYSEDTFERIERIIRKSYHTLNQTKRVDSIISSPF